MDEQIIIDIPTDNLIASLQALKEQFDANRAAMQELEQAEGDNTAAIIELQQKNKVLKGEMQGVEKQIQNNIKQERAQEGSLVALRAELANLNKQYDSMSGLERASAAGVKLSTRISELSTKIGGLEADTGRFQRNVGNYKSALQGLQGGFKAAGLATGGLDKSLKLLNGTPIILALTAIVTVVRAIIKSFKDNEERTMALKEAFSAFNPIIDAMKRGMEAAGKVIATVVTAAVNGLTSAIGWVLEKAQQLNHFFGGSADFATKFKEGTAAARELAQEENEYIRQKRAFSVESARIDRDVAELREKASDKERYSNAERLKFLDEAIRLEEQRAEQQKQLAVQAYEIAKQEAARSANSAADNDKLAEAERAVIEAETQLANTKRTLNRQRLEAVNAMRGEVQAAKQVREQLEAVKVMTLQELDDARQKRNTQLADSLQAAAERAGLLSESVDKLPLDRFAAFSTATDEGLTDATSKWELFAESFRENADTIAGTAQALGQSFTALSSIYTQLANDEAKSEEERAEYARKAKIWASMQIAANSGVAIMKGVMEATSKPFPANLVAIATTMASILSAIAQAKQIASQGFASGGVVGGYVGASMGADNTYIHARSGEMILNAKQQRRLFDMVAGGGKESMTAALVTALRSMPSPVLDYREFTEFTRSVSVMDGAVKLK